jgi:alpha-L-fucosidase 2
MRAILAKWPDRWQFYCNGWGHYGPRDIMHADASLRLRTTLVRDTAEPDREAWLQFPAWPFRHMGMESMSVLACALNESLLQSHDGVLRIAPAATPDQNARFTLHAAGGFVVSAEIEQDAAQWVAIESRRGGTCRVANPWAIAHLYHGGALVGSLDSRTVVFDTLPGERYVLAPSPEVMANWQLTPAAPLRNDASKATATKRASLGLPRMF